jgi:hypothetical protein
VGAVAGGAWGSSAPCRARGDPPAGGKPSRQPDGRRDRGGAGAFRLGARAAIGYTPATMLEWIDDNGWILGALAVLSVASLALTAALLPVVVVRLPNDYFARRPGERRTGRRGAANLLWHVLKNGVGAVFVLAGIAMLVLPGQGILTMLIGLLLLDLPGKYRFERWLVSRPRVLRAINQLRQRRGRLPLRVAGEE